MKLTEITFIAGLALSAGDTAFAGGGNWTLIGWNNLGMHCMDDDYSVFSILPPFNTMDAQLINAQGKLVTSASGITITYEGISDLDGSINTTSLGKTNFWNYVTGTYGAALAGDAGLAGTKMPGASNTPQPMAWMSAFNEFEATGVPVAPVDDAGRSNPYPMMRLTARDNAGTKLAQTDIVVPVSGEMDCRACHASTAGPAARPQGGWVNDPSDKRDFRLNILRLHDEKQTSNANYAGALAANHYSANGLYATATGGTAVLCASCHASEALGTGGYPGVPPLTRSMHSLHANVVAPSNGLTLENTANRSSCYQCHPGSATRCLRGAMGSSVAADGTMAMQCQSCHGSMSQVGASTRTGWLDEPQCANCHTGTATSNNGQIRYTNAFDVNGALRAFLNGTFATNADTPMAGKSLYRFSKGHGGLQCEACHGSTHAEYPSSHRNDNVQSVQLQGHVGTLTDCTACHATMPNTVNGGPHGMHPISSGWVTNHHDLVQSVGLASCQACHGKDYRGTVLSRAAGDRTFSTKYGTKTFYRGYEVSCYSCHNGVDTDSASTRTPPTVADARLSVTAASSAPIALTASGTNPVLRIVKQPTHGTVALSGKVATYFPDAGFSGPDSFLYNASDSAGYVDSTRAAMVSVSVANPFTTVGMLDSDGDGLPDLLEYALGMNPQFPATPGTFSPVLETVGADRYLSLTLPKFQAATDATVIIEVSSDLVNWVPATTVTNSSTLFKARDAIPISAAPRRFMRVRVTQP